MFLPSDEGIQKKRHSREDKKKERNVQLQNISLQCIAGLESMKQFSFNQYIGGFKTLEQVSNSFYEV